MQDAAWREQQRRLLSAHFGPREVESLAMNSVLPLDREEGSVAGSPLLWVQQREMKVRIRLLLSCKFRPACILGPDLWCPPCSCGSYVISAFR